MRLGKGCTRCTRAFRSSIQTVVIIDPISRDQICRGTLVLPRWLAWLWEVVVVILAMYTSFVGPYIAFMHEPCGYSTLNQVDIIVESFFAVDLCLLFLGARKWALQILEINSFASLVALKSLVRTSSFFWRVVPCLSLPIYSALDCELASYVLLLWLMRLQRGLRQILRLKNNIVVNWDVADLWILVVSQITIIHL